MSKFHINLSGNPGTCKARTRCPFGGEDEHYSDANEARQAYETSMVGEEIHSYKRKLKADHKARRAEAKREGKDRIAPKAEMPVDPDVVYTRALMELDRVDKTDPNYAQALQLRNEQAEQARTDARANYNLLRSEYQYEDATLNDLPDSRSAITDFVAHRFYRATEAAISEWIDRETETQALSATLRIYKTKLAEFQKAGLSLPHVRAFAATESVREQQGPSEISVTKGSLNALEYVLSGRRGEITEEYSAAFNSIQSGTLPRGTYSLRDHGDGIRTYRG